MSAVEFGITMQTPFVETPVHGPFTHHYNRVDPLVDPCEDRSQFSRPIGPMTPETRLRQLIEFSGDLVSRSLTANPELDSFLADITKTLRRIVNSDLAVIGRSQIEHGRFQVMALDTDDGSAPTQQSIERLAEGWNDALSTGKGWTGNLSDLNPTVAVEEGSMAVLPMQGCVFPLVSRGRVLGLIALGKRDD